MRSGHVGLGAYSGSDFSGGNAFDEAASIHEESTEDMIDSENSLVSGVAQSVRPTAVDSWSLLSANSAARQDEFQPIPGSNESEEIQHLKTESTFNVLDGDAIHHAFMKLEHLSASEGKAVQLNELTDYLIKELLNILKSGISRECPDFFSCMKVPPRQIEAVPERLRKAIKPPTPPTRRAYPVSPEKHWSLTAKGQEKYRLRYQKEVQQINDEYIRCCHTYRQQMANYEIQEKQHLDELKLANEHRSKAEQAEQKRVSERNNVLMSFKHDVASGDGNAVSRYFHYALQLFGFIFEYEDFDIVYSPDSRRLILQYQLPNRDIIPEVRTYRYVKSRNSITQTLFKKQDTKKLYTSVIAQIALLAIVEVFRLDFSNIVDTVCFNGMYLTTDPSTGHTVFPCLISVQANFKEISELNLERVDPVACLKHLSAVVSRDPNEVVPVRPLIKFDKNDSRFVTEENILSDLDQRPNLMELTPAEFESLVTNLFSKMGLDTKLTQPSRDGGVDCIAYDSRPILGGKVVIQAKRYKNTVGVAAVRDLYGTMMNEGASKGILVTTSGYGSASDKFAKNKPLELIDGSGLLSLLKEYAGVEAKIVVPNDWVDSPLYSGEI